MLLNHLIFTGADFAIVSSTYYLPSAPNVEPTKLLEPTPSQGSREVASEGRVGHITLFRCKKDVIIVSLTPGVLK